MCYVIVYVKGVFVMSGKDEYHFEWSIGGLHCGVLVYAHQITLVHTSTCTCYVHCAIVGVGGVTPMGGGDR